MKRPYIWGIIVLVVLAFVVVYSVFDPTTEQWFPKCRLYQLTGYKCPGCGSQRMLHSLLHLDFASAFRYNAFLLTVFPVLVLLLLWDGWEKRLSHKWANRTTYFLAGLFLGSILLWWVLRNVFDW